MSGSREVITGGDFKRMISGAYSEFLLEYENINELGGAGTLAGTHLLRTLGAIVSPLAEMKDASGIAGLCRRISTAAVFGARGDAGVLVSQILRGIGAGLSGKYEATGEEFGKAFQYGILYAHRIIPEKTDHGFVQVSKAVAKGAYHAVRAELPITEILEQAIAAADEAINKFGRDAGGYIMDSFLRGCLKGLDGNFVSPTVSLSLGVGIHKNMPDPREDAVRPYCIRLRIKNAKASISAIEQLLQDFGDFSVVEKLNGEIYIHLHTDRPGAAIDQVIGLGPMREVKVTNMSESHVLPPKNAPVKVAALAVAGNADEAEELENAGASILVSGSETDCPSVAELVGAAHSDFANAYILVSSSPDFRLVFRQAKRLLGDRVELVLKDTREDAIKALKKFSPDLSAEENARTMNFGT